MKSRDKVETLRTALSLMIEAVEPGDGQTQIDAIALSRQALQQTAPRVKHTLEQRAIAKMTRKLEAQQGRIIKQLASLGIKNGERGQSSAGDTLVTFTSDVSATPTGYVIDVRYENGTEQKAVNAFAWRPVVAAAPVAPVVKREKSEKQQKRAAGGRKG
jgi:ABC-type enterochelin transport system substrate-binding protein